MRRSQSLSRALMRSLSRWRLWEYAPAMLRHMPEQRDSGVSQHLKKPFHPRRPSGDGEGVPCYVEPPVIAGHEFSGRVVKLGPGAAEKHGVKLGDLTVSEQIVPCKACK